LSSPEFRFFVRTSQYCGRQADVECGVSGFFFGVAGLKVALGVAVELVEGRGLGVGETVGAGDGLGVPLPGIAGVVVVPVVAGVGVAGAGETSVGIGVGVGLGVGVGVGAGFERLTQVCSVPP